MRAEDRSARQTTSVARLRGLQPSPEAARALRAVGELRVGELPDPIVGQAWRAVWADQSVLGVVLATEDGCAEFAPFTVDLEYADPFTAILDANVNPLPVAVAVFAGLTTPLPLFTLQGYLGEFDTELVEDIIGLWQASLAGEILDTRVATGGVEADDVEARRAFRVGLSFLVSQIAMADLVGEVDSAARTTLSIPRLLNEAGIPPSKLAEIIDIPLADARSIASGRAPLSVAQAEQLAPELGQIDPLDLTAVPESPPGLLKALNHPRRFGVVRALAANQHIDEIAAVRQLPALQAARRQNASDDEDSAERFWADMLDKFSQGR